MQVVHRDIARIADAVAGPARAEAQVGLLLVEEVVGIEAAEALEGGAADDEAASADPRDLPSPQARLEPDHPFQRFERIDSNIVRGPGTSDMKGGIVVALTALEALRKVGALDKLNITVVLHGDEEDSGAPLAAARETIIEAAPDSPWAELAALHLSD